MAHELRVAVAGAMGRMGTVAREALQQSGRILLRARAHVPIRKHEIFDSLDDVLARKPDVLLDLTTQPASYEISLAAVARGVCVVVGASGWSDEQRAALGALAQERRVGALIVPNFSIGATLMMRFAQEAARFFPDVEIVELHHAGKERQTVRDGARNGRAHRARHRQSAGNSQRSIAGTARASRGALRRHRASC